MTNVTLEKAVVEYRQAVNTKHAYAPFVNGVPTYLIT